MGEVEVIGAVLVGAVGGPHEAAFGTSPSYLHENIMNGGKLELVMGSKPNKSWGADPASVPPSMSDNSI